MSVCTLGGGKDLAEMFRNMSVYGFHLEFFFLSLLLRMMNDEASFFLLLLLSLCATWAARGANSA